VHRLPSESGLRLDQQFPLIWEPTGNLQNICFSPDSKSIAISRWHKDAAVKVEDHTIWLLSLPEWRTENSKTNFEHTPIERVERIPVLFAKASVFSPDGRHLAINTRTAAVLWSIPERRVVWSVPNSSIHRIAFSPDGKFVVIGGNDRLVLVVNAEDGSIRYALANHRAPIRTMDFSPDSRLLATAAGDGAIKLWHMATGQELMEFSNPGQDVQHIQFAEDGRHLICQIDLPDSDSSGVILILNGSPEEQ
jgi:WD40 repeat protein